MSTALIILATAVALGSYAYAVSLLLRKDLPMDRRRLVHRYFMAVAVALLAFGSACLLIPSRPRLVLVALAMVLVAMVGVWVIIVRIVRKTLKNRSRL